MRASRRGMVDLIVMIVMIVFLLGMATLAWLTYDKAQKERSYLAALREIPAKQRAEIDSVRARYADLSSLIGFKGHADFTSPDEIAHLLEEGAQLAADFYVVPAPPAEGATERLSGTIEVDGRTRVRGTSINTDPVYRPQETGTLQAGIGRQDFLINRLVTVEIPRVAGQRKSQVTQRAAAAARRLGESAVEYQRTRAAADGADESRRAIAQNIAEQEANLAAQLEAEQTNAQGLNSAAVREQREEAFRAARDAAEAMADAVRNQDAYRLMSDKRRIDDSRDPDGSVLMVSEASRYVWIDIGQRSGVHLEQTFQVVRPVGGRGSEVTIAEIRVKELVRGNIARCRVDSVDDESLFPMAGDLIKNPNFSARNYQKWALVGTFGGEFTSYTRQQLTDMLRGSGFQVVDRIDLTVGAVILGGNWMQDPEWAKARELGLNIETYPEDEVLHFLGRSGPDRD